MKTGIIKVTDKGQISLPIKMRKLLGINKGDDLIIINNNDSMIIKKIKDDDFSDLLKLSEISLGKIWHNE